jgi:2-oxoglutarate dehydrogenase E1 component
MNKAEQFHGPNLGYVLELYDRYQQDPESVDQAAKDFFAHWKPPRTEVEESMALDSSKVLAIAKLAQAIREFGYLEVQLDPLGNPPPGDPTIGFEYYDLQESDLERFPAAMIGGPIAEGKRDAAEAIQALRGVYCEHLGYDYEHVRIREERDWLRESAERGRFRTSIDYEDLLVRLTQVEVFEQFLHRIYPGKTRFSIEGLDMMIPMLDEIITAAAQEEICMILIGMAHRGRLNVLAHVVRKPYEQILAEFKDPHSRATTWDSMGWTGDVKYHMGGVKPAEGDNTIDMLICLPSNPSHLEHINPVVEGMAHAADSKVDRPGLPDFFPNASLPILIHGDASFTGQGVVAETLNFSRLEGYQTAGTIHIIADNQLGFTTTPEELRSTLFASDLAKGFKIPVMHVNADHPLACIEAARTAFAYRERFHKDFLINLVGYRRYGHNEGDEPSFTQPLMYQKIRQHPSVRKQLADSLEEQGKIDQGQGEELVRASMQELQDINEHMKVEEALEEPYPQQPPKGAAKKVDTTTTLKLLRELNEALLHVPQGFNLHPKLLRAMQRRQQLFEKADEHSIDWATAEELSLATILHDGVAIRLTGEDAVRGTFSQRHAVFYDGESGEAYTPLQSIPQAKCSFEIHNTPLTETAALGFEFGYNIQAPERMVIWEAQYGDFINVGQVMIDEFIASARSKWGQTPSIVLLLPHGNEGQGPDHTSARQERFLELAAEHNIRIANPTTAAQYFHLLRRQAKLLKTDPLPLVVFTPKGLLRHPLTASRPRDLSKGAWQPVLLDPRSSEEAEGIHTIVFCNGRLYIDLVTSDAWEAAQGYAVVRLEQLYPFPQAEVRKALQVYPNAEQVLWAQEEPRNMGAWRYIHPLLAEFVDGEMRFNYVGRPASSSPAEGSTSQYHASQQALIKQVFNPNPPGG